MDNMEPENSWTHLELRTLAESSRKGVSLEQLSHNLNRSQMSILLKSRELAGIKTDLPEGNLVQRQLEEFFNRCRKKLSSLPTGTFFKYDNRPLDGGSPINLLEPKFEKKPISLSQKMPDPFLKPSLNRRTPAPRGENKIILERERIYEYRRKYPKSKMKCYHYCLHDCPIGKQLRYNQKCSFSGGIFTYMGQNYNACLFFEKNKQE